MGTIITLSKPIKVQGEEVSEIEFADPTLGILRGIKADMSSHQIILHLIEKLTKIPGSSVDQIDWRDLAKINAFLLPFLDGLES